MSSKSSGNDSDKYYGGMDAFQVLGVDRNADVKEIKSAYRKLVSQWHPDKFPDDEAKKIEGAVNFHTFHVLNKSAGGIRMERINRAYYCLSDEDRRRRYEQVS